MNKYALTLSKTGCMKYISHLDLMRLFRNTFKRADIRLVYSQGFNPHPKMSFALPLSLGTSSVCELLEFESQDSLASEEIQRRIAPLLPTGIELLACKTLPPTGKTLAAQVVAAAYDITIPLQGDASAQGKAAAFDLPSILDGFKSRGEIIARKKGKQGKEARDIDIKPLIREISGEVVDDHIVLHAVLLAGSNRTLNPALFIGAFLEFAGLSTHPVDIEIQRTALYF